MPDLFTNKESKQITRDPVHHIEPPKEKSVVKSQNNNDLVQHLVESQLQTSNLSRDRNFDQLKPSEDLNLKVDIPFNCEQSAQTSDAWVKSVWEMIQRETELDIPLENFGSMENDSVCEVVSDPRVCNATAALEELLKVKKIKNLISWIILNK